jgi:hypothetical protein
MHEQKFTNLINDNREVLFLSVLKGFSMRYTFRDSVKKETFTIEMPHKELKRKEP